MHLLVFSPYYPPHTGGLESHSEEFNKYFAESGTSITVFTPRLPGDTPEHESKNEQLHIIRFPAFEIIPNYPLPKFWERTFWKAWKGLREQPSNLVLSRTRFFFTSLMAWRYARLRKLPWIHIEHGSSFVKLSGRTATFLAWVYDLTFGKAVLRSSDANVSISKAVHAFVVRFDKRPSQIIYRGIDFAALDSIKAMEPMDKSKIRIATAARLYKWKGIEDTLAAIQRLPESLRKRIIFSVIGDGADYARLKELARDLPVEFLGRKSREETISIMKGCDIYVHSSHPGGGLSTSLLEAMCCHCAVIATPHEGADEIVEDGASGLVVRSVSEITAAITALADDPALRGKLSQEAAKRVRERFDWNRSIRSYQELFKLYV